MDVLGNDVLKRGEKVIVSIVPAFSNVLFIYILYYSHQEFLTNESVMIYVHDIRVTATGINKPEIEDS